MATHERSVTLGYPIIDAAAAFSWSSCADRASAAFVCVGLLAASAAGLGVARVQEVRRFLPLQVARLLGVRLQEVRVQGVRVREGVGLLAVSAAGQEDAVDLVDSVASRLEHREAVMATGINVNMNTNINTGINNNMNMNMTPEHKIQTAI